MLDVVLAEVDPVHVAEEWFSLFAKYIGDTEETVNLLCVDALWRDLLALTWDMRTFEGSEKIRLFLDQRNSSPMRALRRTEFIQLQRPYPDLAWIVGTFEFDVDIGHGTGVFRLVPTATGQWKAFTIFTNLESLTGFPSAIGPLRNPTALPGRAWAERLLREREFGAGDPAVLIIGAGQSALSLAARLKYLDVPTLMVEKDPRVGDSWRKRYDALCLHFPVWNDHMPYLHFPPTWPVYTPSLKIAEWLESYATLLELNVWTSSTVESALQDDKHKWSVCVRREDGSSRVLVVNHLVFATGVGDGHPNIPDIKDSALYTGPTLHSSLYHRAAEFNGHKVLVIGSGNSGLYKEGGPSLGLADNLYHSLPHLLLEGGMAQRSTKTIMDAYSNTLEELNKAGFRTNKGIKDAGLLLQLKERAGGHYFDTGGSQLIIDGKIKLKNDSSIKSFYANGLEFEDGSKIEVSAVIFATG
ncbi:hypothetical protein C0991_000372 [Blastosporella zonata]|nr:hypothetical protein C0991_000372 [Blastosporella zonata]